MKYHHHLEFETTEKMSKIFVEGHKPLSDIIVDVAFKNLKTKRKNIPVVSITTQDDDLVYEIMIVRTDMIDTLEQNLEIMEEYEDYERCQKITDALHYLNSQK